MIILKEKLIKSQQENTEARVQLEADVTPRMIKRLHQIIAKVQQLLCTSQSGAVLNKQHCAPHMTATNTCWFKVFDMLHDLYVQQALHCAL